MNIKEEALSNSGVKPNDLKIEKVNFIRGKK